MQQMPDLGKINFVIASSTADVDPGMAKINFPWAIPPSRGSASRARFIPTERAKQLAKTGQRMLDDSLNHVRRLIPPADAGSATGQNGIDVVRGQEDERKSDSSSSGSSLMIW